MENLVEKGKKAAAIEAAEYAVKYLKYLDRADVTSSRDLVRSEGMVPQARRRWVVGIGSGSTVVYVVQHLAELIQREQALNEREVVCLPSSYQATQLILEHKLTLGVLNSGYIADITIDGADEIDPQLNLIKGGGGCHTQEKLLAAASRKFIVAADFRKRSRKLNTEFGFVPVEVIPEAHGFVRWQLLHTSEGIGVDTNTQAPRAVTLRMAKAKAGPVVTDNGNFILDVDFGGIEDPVALNQQLTMLAGVVSVGLFTGKCAIAFLGERDGSTSRMITPGELTFNDAAPTIPDT